MDEIVTFNTDKFIKLINDKAKTINKIATLWEQESPLVDMAAAISRGRASGLKLALSYLQECVVDE